MASEGEMRRRDERPVPTISGFTDLVLIGHGGSSTVFSATQVALGRRVALKVLGDIGDQSRRLEREARALSALSGAPHVVQVHDVVTTADGNSVLVMPLLAESLTARVRSQGPQPLGTVSRWATQIALGLDAAHRRGISHR
ncbi:MAG: protein kinase, partial [Actinobacteria bacterium]|nr:protein kinase [Actinomycetota bacterium]